MEKRPYIIPFGTVAEEDEPGRQIIFESDFDPDKLSPEEKLRLFFADQAANCG